MPVHTAAVMTNWMVAKRFQVIQHPPPYLPDFTPADFFLFPRVKRELASKPSPRRPSGRSGRGLSEPSLLQT